MKDIEALFGVFGGHYVHGLNAYLPPLERRFASVALEVGGGPFDSSNSSNFMFPVGRCGRRCLNVGLGIQKVPKVCGKYSWLVDSNLILF